MSAEGKGPQATPPNVRVHRYPPFTRLDEHGRATTQDFERERMGIAAKE